MLIGTYYERRYLLGPATPETFLEGLKNAVQTSGQNLDIQFELSSSR